MVTPPWIAKVQRARIGQRANGRAADTADNGSGSGITAQRANRRAGTGAEKAAGHGTVFRSRSARTQCEGGRNKRGRRKSLHGH